MESEITTVSVVPSGKIDRTVEHYGYRSTIMTMSGRVNISIYNVTHWRKGRTRPACHLCLQNSAMLFQFFLNACWRNLSGNRP